LCVFFPFTAAANEKFSVRTNPFQGAKQRRTPFSIEHCKETENGRYRAEIARKLIKFKKKK